MSIIGVHHGPEDEDTFSKLGSNHE
jgi:hypothetical protein